jgi:hypothetical protein
MYAKPLESLLTFMFEQNLPVLIKGAPGIGKSDIVAQSADKLGWELIISHPVVADPTDYKGLPFAVDGHAKFLPFGDLEKLLSATKPVIYFLDDLGQATPAVQSAVMQLLLARQINGHKISPEVRFVAATNRRADKANVSGILEPVKSRFASIVELEVNTKDWVEWGWKNNMPFELISFIEFKPEMLSNFVATRDIENSPCPRTVAFVGKMVNAGLPQTLQFEAIKGAAGEAFAHEYLAFVRCYMNLPTVSEIIKDPNGARLPNDVSARFAICGALTDALEQTNISPIIIYLKRLGNELTVAALKNASLRKPAVTSTKEFIQWAMANSDLII